MKQRIWSAAMAFILLLTLLPATAWAAEAQAPDHNSWTIQNTDLPGIGSIGDVFVPPPSTAFGVQASPAYHTSYYEQLDSSSQAVYDAIRSSTLNDGPVQGLIPIALTAVPEPERTFPNVTITITKVDSDTVSLALSGDAGLYVNDSITAAVGALLYDHPEFSWLVNTAYSFNYETNFELPDDISSIAVGSSKDYAGQTVIFTEISFGMSEQGYLDATTAWEDSNYNQADTKDRAAIEAAIQDARRDIGSLNEKTNYGKVKAIYEWICGSISYADMSDGRFLNSWRGYQTAYSALVEKVSVCAGYAKAFKLLCDEYEIPCAIITGTGNGQNHAWNYVQINDSWYAVDCTWADQISYVNYQYLLKGADDFSKHTEGQLYAYSFAYPELARENYQEPGAPDSIELSYSSAEDGTASQNPPYFLLPVVPDPETETAKTVTFTAQLTKDGSEISDMTAEWSLTGGSDGITLKDNGDNTATLTFKSSALRDKSPVSPDKLAGDTIIVNAICKGTSASKSLGIYAAYREPTFVRISRDNAAVTSDSLELGSYAVYTTKLYDQYGIEHDQDNMDQFSQTANWSVSPAGTGVTVSDGKVSAAADAELGIYTISAVLDGSSSLRAEFVLTVTDRHTHTADSQGWYYDSANHWHVCSSDVCDHEVFDQAEHDWTVVTQEPTCTQDGSATYTCKVCGQVVTEVLPALGHDCTASVWEYDASAHWLVCARCHAPDPDTMSAHVYDNDTDTTCHICGYVRTVTPAEASFTITFDANGGTVTPGSLATAADGSLESLPVPVRNNNTFIGWFTSANGGSQVTASYRFSEDTTLYAHWSSNSGNSSSSGSSSSSSSNSSSNSNSSSSSSSDSTSASTPSAPYDDTVPWENPFQDVPANAYYLNAVRWALAGNVTSGTSSVTFSPDAFCTRAQMVTFLWRAAGSPEPQSAANVFTDVHGSDYYYNAVLWAAENGITSGTGAGAFSPDAQVTRGQAVAILYQYAGAPAAVSESRFSDVFASDYYANAVRWAAENGITSGTGADTFSPNAVCTRAQIVTFLYQAMK